MFPQSLFLRSRDYSIFIITLEKNFITCGNFNLRLKKSIHGLSIFRIFMRFKNSESSISNAGKILLLKFRYVRGKTFLFQYNLSTFHRVLSIPLDFHIHIINLRFNPGISYRVFAFQTIPKHYLHRNDIRRIYIPIKPQSHRWLLNFLYKSPKCIIQCHFQCRTINLWF